MPGTGLPLPTYAALVLVSVGLFLAWGGLLWRSSTDATHVMRFVVSYLAVIPLAVLALAAYGRLTWAHVTATTGTAWSIKLVLTSILYLTFARGTATRLEAVKAPPSAVPTSAAADEYRPAERAFDAGTLRGSAVRDGSGVGGAVVVLERPSAGRALVESATVDLVVTRSRYAEPLYAARTGDTLRIVSRDPVLHTVHVRSEGRLAVNRPIPPGIPPSALPPLDSGLYLVECGNHPGEVAWLVITDHPYVTRTDAAGRFALEGVPVGPARLLVYTPAGAGLVRTRQDVQIQENAATELVVDVTKSIPPTPAELRN